MSIVANKNIVVCGTIYGGIYITFSYTEFQMNMHVENGFAKLWKIS